MLDIGENEIFCRVRCRRPSGADAKVVPSLQAPSFEANSTWRWTIWQTPGFFGLVGLGFVFLVQLASWTGMKPTLFLVFSV